jgi:hypothetical protein
MSFGDYAAIEIMNKLNLIIFFGFLLRLLYAAWVGIQGYESGLSMDAQGFFMRMILIARSGLYEPMGVGEGIILNSYGTLMGIFAENVFFACFLSCLIWWAAAKMFIASLEIINIDTQTGIIAAALFAFWPTAIPYTAIPIREPAQLMFTNIALFGSLSLLVRRNSLAWVLILIGALGAGRLHGGLSAFAISFIGLIIVFFPLLAGRRFNFFGPVIGLALLIPLAYFGFGAVSNVGYDLSGGVLESIQGYQEKGVEIFGRTNYKDEAEVYSLTAALIALPVGLLQYLFEPMPWRVSAIIDMILTVENLLRLALIMTAITSWRKAFYRNDRLVIAFLFLAYLLQEAFWSIGTVNWGTASRHHVPALGLLLSAGAFAWRMRVERLRYPSIQSNSIPKPA